MEYANDVNHLTNSVKRLNLYWQLLSLHNLEVTDTSRHFVIFKLALPPYDLCATEQICLLDCIYNFNVNFKRHFHIFGI